MEFNPMLSPEEMLKRGVFGGTYFSDLINPKDFPNDESFYRAKGAKDILENVKIYQDLSTSLKDATLIFGTSARTRTIPGPTKNSSELSEILKKSLEKFLFNIDSILYFGT